MSRLWGWTGCTVDIRAYMGCWINESYLKVISCVQVWEVGKQGAGRSGEIPAVISLSCSTELCLQLRVMTGSGGIHLGSPLEPLRLCWPHSCPQDQALRRPGLSVDPGGGFIASVSGLLLTLRKRKTSTGCRMVLWTAVKGRVVQPCK